MSKSKKVTLFITLAAIFIAMEIVFSRFLSFHPWNMKIGLAFFPVMMAGYMLGPVGGAAVGLISDIIGATLFPSGAFFPGFTATATLTGLIFGLCFYKKVNIGRILIAVLSNQLICSITLNSLWLSIMYHSPYVPLIISRIPQTCIMIVVQTAFALIFLDKINLKKRLRIKI